MRGCRETRLNSRDITQHTAYTLRHSRIRSLKIVHKCSTGKEGHDYSEDHILILTWVVDRSHLCELVWGFPVFAAGCSDLD